jgi:hypothetical protein
MPQSFCPEGCYWPCEHRASGAQTTATESARWALGPETGDDPEQAALDEWLLASITGVRPSKMALQVCIECGRTYRDAITHAREHTAQHSP